MYEIDFFKGVIFNHSIQTQVSLRLGSTTFAGSARNYIRNEMSKALIIFTGLYTLISV